MQTLGTGAPIDLDRMVETRLLIQANSGGGKSWAIRRLLEQTHGRVQQIVLDVEGEFHTLRERFDYVLARPHDGDCVAHPKTAALLAEKALELGVSLIADIYELKAHERLAFARMFLSALVNAPKRLWHPALIIIDEAHVFCPQTTGAESGGAVIDLMTRGRKRGFCGVLATQRLSKLHKDAAAEANNKLIGRTGLDVDMKRAAEELGFASKAETLTLRTLPAGTFYAFGPALSLEVRQIQVAGVTTTHPRPGQRTAPTPPPSEKVKAALAKLTDLPKEAEEEQRTNETLRRDLAEARRKLTLAENGTPAIDPRAVEAAEQRGYQRGVSETRTTILGGVDKWLAPVSAAIQEAEIRVQTARREIGSTPAGPYVAPARHPIQTATKYSTPIPSARKLALGTNGADHSEKMPKGERLILTALAQYPEGRTKTQVAVLTGYAVTGGAFNNYLGALRSKGWIEGGGDNLTITMDGIAALGHYDPLPQGEALLQHWRGQLGKAERMALDAVAARYPARISKEEIAAATGYEASGGAFNNALGRLRTLELIEGRGDAIRASEALFG